MKHKVFVFDSTAKHNHTYYFLMHTSAALAPILVNKCVDLFVFVYLKAVVIISALMLDSRESKVMLLSTYKEKRTMRTTDSVYLLQFVEQKKRKKRKKNIQFSFPLHLY